MLQRNLYAGEVVVKSLPPLQEIAQVYSGRPGCMCGCLGKYWVSNIKYATSYFSEEEKRRQVSMRMIRKIYKIFQEKLQLGEVTAYKSHLGGIYSTELHADRVYVMYTKTWEDRHG